VLPEQSAYPASMHAHTGQCAKAARQKYCPMPGSPIPANVNASVRQRLGKVGCGELPCNRQAESRNNRFQNMSWVPDGKIFVVYRDVLQQSPACGAIRLSIIALYLVTLYSGAAGSY